MDILCHRGKKIVEKKWRVEKIHCFQFNISQELLANPLYHGASELKSRAVNPFWKSATFQYTDKKKLHYKHSCSVRAFTGLTSKMSSKPMTTWPPTKTDRLGWRGIKK